MNPPDGFERHSRSSPVTDPWEPIYSRVEGDTVCLGLAVREAHCNNRGIVHGGVITALADSAMAVAVHHTLEIEEGEGREVLTINLAVDFLGPVEPGQWLELRPRVLRTGGTIAFTECLAEAGGEIVARASAAFRLG